MRLLKKLLGLFSSTTSSSSDKEVPQIRTSLNLKGIESMSVEAKLPKWKEKLAHLESVYESKSEERKPAIAAKIKELKALIADAEKPAEDSQD
jgi:hypothetical protein